jgi:hypothetical protein
VSRYTPEQRLAKLKALGVLYDDVWALRISQYAWRVTNRGYVEASSYFEGEPKTIKLHRLVMNALDQPDWQVDHINRNPLDNRVCNLRFACNSVNARNTSRVENSKHIRLHKGYYELRMSVAGATYNRVYKTLQEAEHARQELLDKHRDEVSHAARLGGSTPQQT